MNTDKIVRKSIELISKTVISLMPRSYFTSDENANKYMLTGDSKFSYNKSNCFTCGFGKAVLTPDDVKTGKYFISQSEIYKNFERECGYFLLKYKGSNISYPINLKCLF